jgi:hypothetical protein
MSTKLRMALCAALALSVSGVASTKTITLPVGTMQLEPSDLPGYAKARAVCMTCHSAEYLRYQPPTASRTYWENMVKRMKTVFNAPIDDADVPDIVDYLDKTYN